MISIELRKRISWNKGHKTSEETKAKMDRVF